MKLISSQTEEEREKERRKSRAERAKGDFDQALRVLTANLLRVTRGAGRAWEVPGQLADCITTLHEYQQATGHGMSDFDISKMLNVQEDFLGRGFDDEDWDWYGGIEEAMRGGLQMAASRLLGQRIQQQAAEKEILRGVQSVERAREARRKAWENPTPAQAKARKEAMAAFTKKLAVRARQAAKAEVAKPAAHKPKAAKPPPTPKPPKPPTPPKPPKPKTAGHKAVLAAYKAKRGIE